MLQRLIDRIGAPVLEDAPLRDRTTLRVGGPARFLCEATDADVLAAALAAGRAEGLDTLVIGRGSNLLVADGGFDGLVIANRLTGFEGSGTRVRVGAGEGYHAVVERLADAGLAGLEFAAGVPGTVGGAVFGNAGCYGQAIGDRLVEIELLDPRDGARRVVGPDALEFGYRWSALKRTGEVVTGVALALEWGDPDELRATIARHMGVRATRHPVDLPSAGSYFQNLPPRSRGERRVAAGLLLDRVGCRGLRVGDAAVFDRHANIIVNLGGARAADVLALADEMKRRVLGRFGVRLVEEVRAVGLRGGERS